MVITNIYGGLGNQMFQYALGRKLSQLRNEELKLDIGNFNNYELRDYLLGNFNIAGSIVSADEVGKYKIRNTYIKFLLKKLKKNNIDLMPSVYYERKVFKFDKHIFNSPSQYYEGYWQSYKYFNDIRDALLQDFSLITELNRQNQKMLQKIKNCNAISIHIRRGDYVNNLHTNNIHGLCSLDYYQKAIRYIINNIKNPIFYIFSDDLDWVKDNLKFEYSKIYVDINNGSTPHFDLELIKNCKHHIIANSTFSWWGAWLNTNQSKIVIVPSKWMNINLNFDDLIPNGWIKI